MCRNFNTSQYSNAVGADLPETIFMQSADEQAVYNGMGIPQSTIDIIGVPFKPSPTKPMATTPPKGSLQYVFTKNYVAERPQPNPGEATSMQYIRPKNFKKGDVVSGMQMPNGRIITVLEGPYDITDAVIEWKIGSSNSGSSFFKKEWITPQNIAIAGIGVVALILIFKKRS